MYSLVKGLFNVFIENMFLGIRLDRMYVVFVLLEVVVGVFVKNFYNFRYYNINQIVLYSDGIFVGNIFIKFFFDVINGDSVVLVFVNLFDNVGKWFFDGGNVILENNLQRGVMLYFVLIQSLYLNKVNKQGIVCLEVQFGVVLLEILMVIVLFCFF